jgi:acyl-CoA synthetase (AMP-forming)/AMP-acid ligase II
MTRTLAEMVEEQARQRADAVAISCGDDSVSWDQLHQRSTRLGAALQSAGITAGDRVGLLMKNTPEFHEILFGCNKAGAVAVGLNWRLSARELAEIIGDAAPRVVITDAEHAPLLEELAAPVRPTLTLTLGEDYESWRDDKDNPLEPAPSDPDALALILYSSGTTGKAKGITLSNRNFSFIRNMATDLFRMRSDSVYLLGSPLFHIGGVGTGTALMTLGGRTVLLRDVNPDAILDTIERERVTHTFFVPAVIQRLVEAQEASQRDLSSLELLAYGAAPMTETLLRRAIDVLGCGFLGCYGMTETAGTISALFPEEHKSEGPAAKHLQSVGRALPWAQIKLVDPATGQDAKSGEFGEIWVRSEALTPGYFKNPEATAEALVDGGWFRTGDGAFSDDEGFIYLKDRIKDMIISGGENIYPVEVENVLAQHPGISEAAVIGVPSERWGETVKAVVVAREGQDPDPAGIIAFTRERLAHYKCPTSVDIVDALPRNATGKVLKTELRASYR